MCYFLNRLVYLEASWGNKQRDSRGDLHDTRAEDIGPWDNLPIGDGAERIGGIARDAHRVAGHGGDAGVLIIGSEELVASEAD